MTGAVNSGDSDHRSPCRQVLHAHGESLNLPVYSTWSIMPRRACLPCAYLRRCRTSPPAMLQ
jgi:hypothetical protein